MKAVGSILAALLLLAAAPGAAQGDVESGYVETAPGVSIFYEKVGSGPELVLVPGRLFMPEFRALAGPRRTLVQYDMRNRGRSRRVEDTDLISIQGDVADVEALRRHFGAERVSLIGYSYLGLMVALYAIEHPSRVVRIVQLGPVARVFGTPFPADQIAGLSTMNAAGRAAAEAWDAASEAAPRDSNSEALCQIQRRFTAYLLVGNPDNHVRVPDTCIYENERFANLRRHLGAHFAGIQRSEFAREPFTRLTVPVLTFHGTLDRNAAYGAGLEWATTFRDGRLVTVEGAAHQLWLDDPQVLTEIDRFLDGAWPERARRFGRE